MRQIITDTYKIIYKASGLKVFALIFAIVYISILNLVTIKGLGLLLGELIPANITHKLFTLPYLAITASIVLLANYRLIMPLKGLRKDRKKKPVVLPIIIYTITVIILLAYMRYCTK